jgi:hypothetical protein
VATTTTDESPITTRPPYPPPHCAHLAHLELTSRESSLISHHTQLVCGEWDGNTVVYSFVEIQRTQSHRVTDRCLGARASTELFQIGLSITFLTDFSTPETHLHTLHSSKITAMRQSGPFGAANSGNLDENRGGRGGSILTRG